MLLGGLVTQTFASVEGYLEEFRQTAPAGFVLTQEHLDALNAFEGNDIFSFQSGTALATESSICALSRTVSQGLSPEEIERCGSFDKPSPLRYMLLSLVREHDDAFLENCLSLIHDFEKHKTFDKPLLANLFTLSHERLKAFARAHFDPFYLPILCDEHASLEDESLLALAQLLTCFFEGRKREEIEESAVLTVINSFKTLSPVHVLSLIGIPYKRYSPEQNHALLANAASLSAMILPLIPRLFQSHPDTQDLFVNLVQKNPLPDEFSRIFNLPGYLKARYFFSGVEEPTQEEIGHLNTLFQDDYSNHETHTVALAHTKPTSQEIANLVSMRLPLNLNAAALYAKDFIPLANPDLARSILFSTLLRDYSSIGAENLAKSFFKNENLDFLYSFQNLHFPHELKNYFIKPYLRGQISDWTMKRLMNFILSYTKEEQMILFKTHADALASLSSGTLDYIISIYSTYGERIDFKLLCTTLDAFKHPSSPASHMRNSSCISRQNDAINYIIYDFEEARKTHTASSSS